MRIRAYRDLRRLSPPTPEALRLQHLPYAVCASTLWEQRACVLDGAIGRSPAQVRVPGGLVRAVCSAWRSSQCGSRGLHGCTWRHVCACDRRAGGGAGERRRALETRVAPRDGCRCIYQRTIELEMRVAAASQTASQPRPSGYLPADDSGRRCGRSHGVALASSAVRSWHATRRRTRYFVIVRFRFITKHTFGRCASSNCVAAHGTAVRGVY